MPAFIHYKRTVHLLFLSLVLCFSSCSPPKDWEKLVPGVYEGTVAGHTEKLVFQPDGVYIHEVSKGAEVLYSETGKWSVRKGEASIGLDPDGYFSQIYDPMTKQLAKSKGKGMTARYFPVFLRNGFERISPSVDYDYTLLRARPKRAEP